MLPSSHTTSFAYILLAAGMIDLVIHLRPGQERGPSLQLDDVMVLKQEE